jgi:hypothetical protein
MEAWYFGIEVRDFRIEVRGLAWMSSPFGIEVRGFKTEVEGLPWKT